MSPFRLGISVFIITSAVAGAAFADHSTIRSDHLHPRYVFEAEPHLVLAPFHDGGVGAGFAGTINLVDRGFIPRLNDSVGLGFAANWATNEHFVLSAAMQWNFWFTERWSAFGEPGLAIGTHDDLHVWPHLGAGGRFAFNDTITLTMRLGFPVSSVGVSFLL